MLEELAGAVLINGVLFGQLQGDFEHDQAVKPHPESSVRLIQMAAGMQRLAAIKDTDVIQAQDPP